MARRLGCWRQFHHSPASRNAPLLIFPHAGAGASAYRAASKVFSARFDVSIAQYPGVQDRAAESPLDSFSEIAVGALDEYERLSRNRNAPISVLGNSVGGLVAFEFTRIA